LLNFYLDIGLSTPAASTACSITLVGISAVLTGFGVYDKIAKFGGGGTLVPITGFANAVVSPAMEFKSEGFVLGLGVKIFTIAGPVIVYGVLASFVYGVVYWFIKTM
jgi:stage V sporulation protein AC